MQIIGLVGNKGVGKDTVAKYFIDEEYNKVAFADTLKESLKVLFNWDDELYDQKKKEMEDEKWGVSPRTMLQLLGTDFLRNYCKKYLDTSIVYKGGKETFSYHIKKLFLDIREDIEKGKKFIFSDIRFQDELNFVKLIGGTIFKIERNVGKNKFSSHESEMNIDSLERIDYTIENNSTINNLYKKLSIITEMEVLYK